ncbi:TPM domain-containing protein [Dendrosporobacter sp. 1207_IL3150]|uniref:TPM domain-containing protein n=1 Tax=Dendrosporobacter sp. 1207_IL3150 TaxID=3084054 RepID=UPI002FD8FBFD
MKKWLAWLLVIAYLAVGATAWAAPNIPAAPTNSIYVQDYAGVLSADTKKRINDLGSKLAVKTKAQVVVVTINSLGDTPPEEYALTVLRQWGIGDKTLNNGVLMLVATGDRKSRIEVGYGLEGALPDAKTGQIQDQYMLPYFRQGDYDKGILNGYLALTGVVAKEYNIELKTDARPTVQQTAPESGWDTLPWWLKLIIMAGALLLFIIDWVFLGGSITWFLLSILRFRGGGGGGGRGGFGGGSGGGGGSNRGW